MQAKALRSAVDSGLEVSPEVIELALKSVREHYRPNSGNRNFDDPAVRAAYVAALSDPGHVHAICEEYRAAAGLDREHDAGDRRAGRRIACPLLVLWSADGPLGTWYTEAAGR